MRWKNKRFVKKALKYYGQYYRSAYDVINRIIQYYKKMDSEIAIWGGGLKGTAFLEVFGQERNITCIFDIAKEKQGTKTVYGHSIVAPEGEDYRNVEVVLVMNNQHETEIAARLKEVERSVKLFNVDSIILGEMSFDEAIAMYGGNTL